MKQCIIIVTIMMSNFIYSQNSPSIKQSLNLLADEFCDSLNFNGSLLVSKGNDVLLNKSFGYSNFEHSIKNSDQTRFRIASVSKMFTSYAIYILASQERLFLEDSIVKYIPNLSSQFENLTLNHLLKHRSGLIRSIDIYLKNAPHLSYSKEEIIEAINKTSLSFNPDEKFQYSNVGYILLGLIIENVTGKSYGEAMKNLVFSPLGLQQTSHEVEGNLIANMASGYNMLDNKTLKSAHENKSHVLGAGSIVSSVNDLLLFSKEILTGSLLDKSLHKKYLEVDKNYRTNSGLVTWNYSSKLPFEKDKGQIVMHSGLCPGFSSSVIIFLEHNLIVVSLSNRNPIDMSKIYNKLGNVALGFDKEPVNKPTINGLVNKIVKGELDLAFLLYKQMLIQDSSRKIKPSKLNNLGYNYLQYHMCKKAINIFTFFTMIYPENANSYDGLGESYLRCNNTTKAISAYKKSIKLNPNNNNAKRIIKAIIKD